jgi:short-subunit dehydrogenase
MSEAPRKVAILGATSTIAEACARAWAARGDVELFLAARREDELEAIARDLGVRGAKRVAAWAGDLADTARHPDLLAALDRELPRPDAVLLAWGTLTDQDRAEAEPAYALSELATNFTAPASLLLALAPRVAAPGGVIACITSVAGDRGRQSNLVYGAAKGGLQRLLEGLRHRLHGKGVAVLDIRPGFVATRMTEHLPDRKGPLWATPDQVARDILRAVDRRGAVLYTPWFWRWIMLAVRNVPRPLLHRTKL